MRIEKTEQGKTKNGLRYYLFPRTGFGEQMAAVLVQRGANTCFGREGMARKSAFRRERRILSSISCFSRNGAMPLHALRKMAHLPMPLPMATGRFIILPVRINLRKI